MSNTHHIAPPSNPGSRRFRTTSASPGAPERPHRHGYSAGAGGAEHARGGVPGHRDLVARAEVDPRALVEEDRAEQDDVAEERERFEAERQGDPAPVGAAEPREA